MHGQAIPDVELSDSPSGDSMRPDVALGIDPSGGAVEFVMIMFSESLTSQFVELRMAMSGGAVSVIFEEVISASRLLYEVS